MIRQSVTSSDVVTIGFEVTGVSCVSDADTGKLEIIDRTGTVEVEFKRPAGSTYQYYDVPQSEYTAILTAASIGRALHAHVKTKNYAYKKVA